MAMAKKRAAKRVPVTKRSKVRQRRKKPVVAYIPPQDKFRVDLEAPKVNQTTGLTNYTYVASGYAFEEAQVRRVVEELKQMGIGGRLVQLDGTPDGTVVERWGSVARVGEAEKIERAALEKTGEVA